jgi:hypothetical protein
MKSSGSGLVKPDQRPWGSVALKDLGQSDNDLISTFRHILIEDIEENHEKAQYNNRLLISISAIDPSLKPLSARTLHQTKKSVMMMDLYVFNLCR